MKHTKYATYAKQIKYVKRAINEYKQIVNANPKIDVGHSVNHVVKVEELTRQALNQLLTMEPTDPNLTDWINKYPKSNLQMPDDVAIRVEMASLLHEVGDQKFGDGTKLSKEDIIAQVLDRILHDYKNFNDDMKNDIIRMIDLCTSSKWGDQIPEGTSLYQFIPRWADRLEATGIIGIVRCLTYSMSKRDKGYPLCLVTDDFPTTQQELENVAPYQRWLDYSNGKPSKSAFGHLQDKIRHINGNDVPIPCLKSILNEGQQFVDQFILDFTNVNEKKFDLDWIIDHIDSNMYELEVDQLKEMQKILVNYS